MLRRPPADDDRKRQLRKARKKRRAEREAAGLSVCPVEHDDAMVTFLIDLEWLKAEESDDPVKIGAAVSAMWLDAMTK